MKRSVALISPHSAQLRFDKRIAAFTVKLASSQWSFEMPFGTQIVRKILNTMVGFKSAKRNSLYFLLSFEKWKKFAVEFVRVRTELIGHAVSLPFDWLGGMVAKAFV